MFAAEAAQKFGASDTSDINAFVAAAITALEQQATSIYDLQLYPVFGPGGSYAPGTTNTFDPATNSNVSITSSLLAAPVDTEVTFGNAGGHGTITLTAAALAAGASWSSYSVGEGIYVQGTGANGNGATFNSSGPNAYYTIGAINGATITLNQSLTESGVTVGLAPVAVGTVGLAATPVSTNVSFGNNASNLGTVTLTGGGSWTALGYQDGQGIYIGSGSDPTATGRHSIPMAPMRITRSVRSAAPRSR